MFQLIFLFGFLDRLRIIAWKSLSYVLLLPYKCIYRTCARIILVRLSRCLGIWFFLFYMYNNITMTMTGGGISTVFCLLVVLYK